MSLISKSLELLYKGLLRPFIYSLISFIILFNFMFMAKLWNSNKISISKEKPKTFLNKVRDFFTLNFYFTQIFLINITTIIEQIMFQIPPEQTRSINFIQSKNQSLKNGDNYFKDLYLNKNNGVIFQTAIYTGFTLGLSINLYQDYKDSNGVLSTFKNSFVFLKNLILNTRKGIPLIIVSDYDVASLTQNELTNITISPTAPVMIQEWTNKTPDYQDFIKNNRLYDNSKLPALL